MQSKVMVPQGKRELYLAIFSRCNSYIKTKDILKRQYDVDIYLEPVR